VKNGHQLTLDDNLGEMWGAGILVEGNIIVEIAPNIDAPNAEV